MNAASLADLRAALGSRELSGAGLLAAARERIDDPAGEGPRAFIGGVAGSASAQAHAADLLRAHGIAGPLSGLPISIKDVFDVQGEITRAGSIAHAPAPAARDGIVAARLRAAGAVLVGRTNMSEFAYSGVGLNPHYGTPSNPWRRDERRIPGGSSSGAAVAVADAMCAAAVGTDTGGSCRIPAALCGLVGFKPAAGSIGTDGMVPLSPSYDAIGSLARTPQCCADLHQVLSGGAPAPLPALSLRGLRIGVPADLVLADLDDEVARRFDAFLAALSNAGVRIQDLPLPAFARLPALAAHGGIVAAEAYAWHRPLLAREAARYDPLIRTRIEAGERTGAADYLDLCALRAELTRAYDAATCHLDALALPTVPLLPPAIDALASPAEFFRVNGLLLRNTAPANVFDTTAVSLPFGEAGAPPAGMMLMGTRHTPDIRLLALADALHQALPMQGRPSPRGLHA